MKTEIELVALCSAAGGSLNEASNLRFIVKSCLEAIKQ